MKLVTQTRLFLRDDRSDKIYEIDLCEAGPDQWVVAFRYGPRGKELREGSKTPVPVAEAEARRVYSRLVASKRAKGYVDELPAPSGAAVAPGDDERAEVLRRYLDEPDEAWTSLDGVIARIGELRVPGCTDRLVALLADADDRTAYNIVRALLRCGDETAVPALHAVWSAEDRRGHVRRLAAHAIALLADPAARERFVRAEAARIPPVVPDALGRGDHERVVRELEEQPRLLERLYLVHTPEQRDGLLALLNGLDVRPPLWSAVRGVYRAAEARSDGPVFGALVAQLEAARSLSTRSSGLHRPTLTWFLRRSWRTLYRLGLAGRFDDYTALAAGVLLGVSDGASHARLWAFNHVLYRGSRRWRPLPRTLTWVRGSGTEPRGGRVEAWPEAWDAHPERLVELLAGSRCAEVHAFAAQALRANPEVWPGVGLDALRAMLRAPYPETGALCVDLATARFDPARPDLELVGLLVECPHEPARALGHGWVRGRAGPFLADAAFVTRLVLAPFADTRALALEVLAGGAVPSVIGRDIVQAVLGWAAGPLAAADDAAPVLADAAVLLQAAFPAVLRELPLADVQALVRREVEGVAELGARVLLGHATAPRDLPDELLVALLTSPFEGVRAVGLRLYQELDPPVLVERFAVLCDLLTSALPDVRHGARPLVARLLDAEPSVGDRLVAALLPILVVEGPEGMHETVVELLRDELAGSCARLDRGWILRLVGATEAVVQALGGDLLVHVDPDSLTLVELVALAGSDIVSVRRSAWALLGDRVDEARRDPEALLGLLTTEWDDTRAFAIEHIEERVGVDALGAELTIAICDSVRPAVRAWGRRTITRMFDTDDGPTYLLKLSQHPSPDMHQFVSAWLQAHAAGDADRMQALVPFFLGVTTRPNQGAVAKARVLAFLEQQAAESEAGARVAAQIARPLSASEAVTHRAWAIRVLAAIRRRWPDVDNPLVVRSVEVRDGV